jgi:hypothetical protein
VGGLLSKPLGAGHQAITLTVVTQVSPVLVARRMHAKGTTMVLGFGWSELDALGSLLGGIFTAAAFGGTLLLLSRDSRARRELERAREVERRDDERRQARLVYVTLAPVPEAAVKMGYTSWDNAAVFVEVFNHSDEPIWDARIPLPGREHDPLLIDRVGPQASDVEGWLKAPQDWYFKHYGVRGSAEKARGVQLDVMFVDNAGRRWRRSGRSEPVRLTDAEDPLPALGH